MSKESLETKIRFDDERIMFKTSVPVLVSHLNYGNHLAHDAVLNIAQETRVRWLKQHQISELALDGSIGYLVTKVNASYKSEAFHGDVLDIEMYIDDATDKKFSFVYKLTNNLTGKVVALVKSEQAYFDHIEKKISNVPEKFQAIIKNP